MEEIRPTPPLARAKNGMPGGEQPTIDQRRSEHHGAQSARHGEDPAPHGEEPARHPQELLAGATPLLAHAAQRFADGFFEAARRDNAELAAHLDRLSGEEFERLKARHARHLRLLLDPGTSAEHIIERAHHGGRVHGMVGVPTEAYAAALGQFRTAAVTALEDWGSRTDRIAVWGVANQRVFTDLRGHLAGHHEVVSTTPQVAAALAEAVTRATTVADLARGVTDTLTSLPGVVASYFGRADSDGGIQFEIGAGEAKDAFTGASRPTLTPVEGEANPVGPSPSARAWATGEIQRSDAYQSDPTTHAGHEAAHQFGLRSSVSIPLSGANGKPRALITAYARWPGYFAEPSRALLVAQVQLLAEQALARLEARAEIAARLSTLDARALHTAMLRNGAVVMHFQPIIDLKTGAIVKFEALARLRGDDRMISPAEFLPSFGAQELWELFEIGLDQSLAALRSWEADGFTTGVAINLPASFPLDREHVDAVVAALKRHDIDAERLTLEVLESGSFELEGSDYRRMLGALHEHGVQVAEDDLGVAYSSLLRIRYVRFDEVKIAQELVRSPGSSEAWGIIQPLANLVHQLGPKVTVEGLETPGLIEAAVYLGADRGQGYAFARPMPAGDVPGWATDFRWWVDPAAPSTELGAFATHLAWESRLRALSSRPTLTAYGMNDVCPMHAFLARDPERFAEATAVHHELHRTATVDQGGPTHIEAWSRMSQLMTG